MDRLSKPQQISLPLKHIFHIIVGLDAGGAEQMLGRLAAGDEADGVARHTVVSLTDLGRIGVELRQKGVTVHALGMKGARDALWVVWRLCRMIREARPDIVQTWMYHADLLGGVAARLAGCKVVLWGVRATYIQYEGSTLTVILRRVCALVSNVIPRTIICVGVVARDAHIEVGYDARRMVIIPNGFDVQLGKHAISHRDAQRAAFGVVEDEVLIGAAGRFNPVKGFDTFIQSAAKVAAVCPKARFLMAGRDLDGANAELTGWIAAAGLQERFILLGERSDLPRCFAAMDIFCLSSLSEGFPNVVGEAMSTALPCVVTDVGDAAVLVGEAGAIVPKADPQAMGEALARYALMTPATRREVGRIAQSRIERLFSIEAARARFAQVYRGERPMPLDAV